MDQLVFLTHSTTECLGTILRVRLRRRLENGERRRRWGASEPRGEVEQRERGEEGTVRLTRRRDGADGARADCAGCVDARARAGGVGAPRGLYPGSLHRRAAASRGLTHGLTNGARGAASTRHAPVAAAPAA